MTCFKNFYCFTVNILTPCAITEAWNEQKSMIFKAIKKPHVILQILAQILVLNQNKICAAVLIFSIKFNVVFSLQTSTVKHSLNIEVEEK